MPESIDPSMLDRRLAVLEQQQATDRHDLATHKAEDNRQFGVLRQDIADLGHELGERMDAMGRRVDQLEVAKARAEGRADGVASVRAAINAPKPLLTTIAGVAVASLLGLVGWMAATIFHQQSAEIEALKNRPVASVTVSPASMAPAPP